MSREPSFDELVGETQGAEREQLQRAHELLLRAGPPPELTPRLASAPALTPSRRRRRRALIRGGALLLAAALAVAVAFAAGYTVGNERGGSTTKPAAILTLRGTRLAPHARATLELWPARAGNWPMTLSVVGLPTLPAHEAYEVYLVRNGRPWAPCGTFVTAGSGPVTVSLNAPYRLRRGDSWVVTRPQAGGGPGATVLRPASA
jgi:hypothetical protein